MIGEGSNQIFRKIKKRARKGFYASHRSLTNPFSDKDTSNSLIWNESFWNTPNTELTEYPSIQGTLVKGIDASATTSRVITLPSSPAVGELLLLWVSGINTITWAEVSGWRRTEMTSGVSGSALYWRYSDGTETTITIGTTLSVQISWMGIRVGGSKPVLIQAFTRDNYSGTNPNMWGFKNGNRASRQLLLQGYAMSTTVMATVPSRNWTQIDTQTGVASSGGIFLQGLKSNLGAFEEIEAGAITSATVDGACIQVAVAFYETGYEREPMSGGLGGRIDTNQMWYSQQDLDDTNYAIGQSFTASGGAIKKAMAWFLKQSSAQTAGTITAKIYAHSGTFGTSSVPTGAALATSNPVNISDIKVADSTYSHAQPFEFTFPTAYQTTAATNYVITFEVSGNGTTNKVYAILGYSANDTGNCVEYSTGAWRAGVSGEDFQVHLIKAVGNTVTSKTQTGVARIRQTVSQTLSGLSRIRKTVLNTQAGLSRIRQTVSQTLTGQGRIRQTVSQTITGVANISVANTVTSQTQTGLSRIQKSVSQVLTGLSRIRQTVSVTQTGLSRIRKTVLTVQTGLSRIRKTVSQTQAGISNIRSTITRTQTGISAVRNTTTRTQTGLTRIARVVSQTQAGISAIRNSTLKTQTGIARIVKQVSQVQLGVGRIQKTVSQTITGVSRITQIEQKFLTGVARIQRTSSNTLTGVARIYATTLQTISGTAYISNGNVTVDRSITGKSAIRNSTLQSISGTASIIIQATTSQTISGKSRIIDFTFHVIGNDGDWDKWTSSNL